MMIDSIGISGICDSKYLKRCVRELENREEIFNEESNLLRIKGKIASHINVSIGSGYISIYGSLSQFYYNSGESLKWSNVKAALEKLEDYLQIKLKGLTLNRIDLESTFVVNKKPSTYYDFLGNRSRFFRNQSLHSLTYSNKNRKLIFYDKKSQISNLSKQDEKLTEEFMRFETSYRSGFIKQLHNKYGFDRSIDSLTDSAVQNFLTHKWFEEYKAIKQEHRPSFQCDINAVADVNRAIYLEGVEALGGRKTVEDMIDRLRKSNPNLTARTVYNMKDSLKKKLSGRSCLRKFEQLEELDLAITINYLLNLLSINESL